MAPWSPLVRKSSELLHGIEWRWSLWGHWTAMLASFSLPAWATYAADVFATYSPLSWVIAGFAGFLLYCFGFMIYSLAYRVRITARFDDKALAVHSNVNPLDKTFEDKRIFVNEFALPSHPYVDGKTFINCEIIGPANIHFFNGNQAVDNRMPRVDTVYLDPTKNFFNGYQFTNCVFRGCSFQRITFFVSQQDYKFFGDHPLLNWISPTPDTMASPNLPLAQPTATIVPPKDESQK